MISVHVTSTTQMATISASIYSISLSVVRTWGHIHVLPIVLLASLWNFELILSFFPVRVRRRELKKTVALPLRYVSDDVPSINRLKREHHGLGWDESSIVDGRANFSEWTCDGDSSHHYLGFVSCAPPPPQDSIGYKHHGHRRQAQQNEHFQHKKQPTMSYTYARRLPNRE